MLCLWASSDFCIIQSIYNWKWCVSANSDSPTRRTHASVTTVFVGNVFANTLVMLFVFGKGCRLVVFVGGSCYNSRCRCCTWACDDSTGHWGYSADRRGNRDADRSSCSNRQCSHTGRNCAHSAHKYCGTRTWNMFGVLANTNEQQKSSPVIYNGSLCLSLKPKSKTLRPIFKLSSWNLV